MIKKRNQKNNFLLLIFFRLCRLLVESTMEMRLVIVRKLSVTASNLIVYQLQI
jgi:hypothetical protein